MADLTRIQPLIDETKKLHAMLISWQVPLTQDEREELLHQHNEIWHTIVNNMPMQHLCTNCKHCVFWENKYCCAARDMAPIPFEVSNNIGGCNSKWEDKDFIPFD